MVKRLFSLVLAVFILACSASQVFAQTLPPLPQGGTSFDSAVSIQPGKYVLNHALDTNVYEFFKISLTTGQNLRVEMTTPAEGYGSATLYDSYKKKQTEEFIIDEANMVKDISIQASRSGDYFFAIGSGYSTSEGTIYDISFQSKTPDENLTANGDGTTAAPTPTLTAQELADLSSNPESVNWGRNPLLIIVVTVVVIIISFLLFRKPSKKQPGQKTATAEAESDSTEATEETETEESSDVEESAPVSSSAQTGKERGATPFVTCLIVTIIAVIGAFISIVSRNPVWVLIFLLPAVIYETMRTQEGASTKVSSYILLGIVILEIGLIVFNVNFNLVDFFGEQEKYIAGYYLPLGDIKVFGPIMVAILSIILLVRTYGPYTKWLSIVIAIGALVAIHIINPLFFQSIVKIIAEGLFNQIGSYF